MRIIKIIEMLNKSIFSPIFCLIWVAIVTTSSMVGQETKTVTKVSGSNVSISTYKEVPEASESCSVDECDWWKRVRQSANKLQKADDDKSKKNFVLLFIDGLDKSYRVPLQDRPSQTLASTFPIGVQKKNGKVTLSVEFRADGSIGDVKILQGLDSDTNSRCVRATRQTIFLPSVRDRAFVSDWRPIEYSFGSNR